MIICVCMMVLVVLCTIVWHHRLVLKSLDAQQNLSALSDGDANPLDTRHHVFFIEDEWFYIQPTVVSFGLPYNQEPK